MAIFAFNFVPKRIKQNKNGPSSASLEDYVAKGKAINYLLNFMKRKEEKIILNRTDSITELQYETIITTTNVLTRQLLM